MPSPTRALGGLLVCLLVPLAGVAQTPTPPPPAATADHSGLTPPPWLETGTPPAPPAPSDDPPAWHFDLLLGLPGGLRLQRDLAGGPWMIEGFVGLELIICPTAGIGIRRQCNLYEGTSHLLQVNPGVDFYLSSLPSGGGQYNLIGAWRGGSLTAADVDLLWKHQSRDRSESYLGLKLGAGVTDGKGWNRIGAMPVVALYVGWGF